jgi:CheY-like chemotaxis protein
MKKLFVVIDDDVSTNFYSKLIIRKTFPESEVSTFSNPLEAIEYFQNTSAKSPTNTIVLLDINMPELSGWEVLDKIEALNELKNTFSIFMISSSINAEDKKRAANHPLVSGYIEKPINKEKLSKMLG